MSVLIQALTEWTKPSKNSKDGLFYVTTLSNFARAYDKFERTYDKLKIHESTFPRKFFLLDREQIQIGIDKAAHLPKKTSLIGDRLIAIQTYVSVDELMRNTRTGLGRYIERSFINARNRHNVGEGHFPSS